SAQRRLERVFCFAATKTKEQSAPDPVRHLPMWLRDDKLPIPRADYITQATGVHQLFNMIMVNIDGARSLSELAQTLAPSLHASPEQTYFIVRKLLLNLME